MNWKELDKKGFMDFLKDTIRNKNIETLESLAVDQEFLDYLKEIKRKKIYFNTDQGRISLLITYLYSFKNVMKLKKIFDNPEEYSIEERKEFFASIDIKKLPYKEVYGKEFANKTRLFIKYYNWLINNPTKDLKEDFVKEKFKKLLEYYKNNNKDDLYYYIFTELKIDFYSLVAFKRLLNLAYCKSITLNDTYKIYKEFSEQDLQEIDDISEYYSRYNGFLGNIPSYRYSLTPFTGKEEEKISNLFDLIHKLEKKYNYDYYEIIYALAHDYNMSYDTLLNEYGPLYTRYSEKKFNGNIEEIDIFKKLYSFYKTINGYADLVSRSQDITKIILGNNPKKERIIEISYYLLVFNNCTPSFNKNRFNLYLITEGKDELLKFVNGYASYYNEHMQEKKENSRQIKQEKELENKRNNLEKYEKIIMSYINSNGLNITEYCKLINITESEFKYIIDVLKELESPIFKAYETYNKKKLGQQFAIIRNKLKIMLDNLMNLKNKYTLLDYYTDTKMSLDDAYNILKASMTPDERRAFMPFYQKNHNEKALAPQKVKELLDNLEVTYALEKDENGNIIKTHDVTREEKEQVLILLKEQKIPITNSTFKLMLKRYFNEYILANYKESQNRL